jgi:tetratricopeptide (TPR) repeat protein
MQVARWLRISTVGSPARFRLRRYYFYCVVVGLLAACWPVLGQRAADNQPNPSPDDTRNKQSEAAISQYEQLLATAPATTPRSTLFGIRTQLATALFMLHRYEDSLRTLEPVIPASSKSLSNSPPKAAPQPGAIPPQAWVVQGLDYLELNRVPEATRSLRQALAVNPNSGTARLALGDALARSGQMHEALREYREQARRAPTLSDPWYKMGLAHSALASELPDKAGEKFRDSVVGQLLAAEKLLAIANNLDAARLLSRLLRQTLAPQVQLHASLGAALLGLGYSKSAENHFLQELSLDPYCPLAKLGLAETAALRGDWDDVLVQLKQLDNMHPHGTTLLLESPPAGVVRQAWAEGRMQASEGFATSREGAIWKAWLSDSGPVQVSGKAEIGACKNPSPKAMAMASSWLPEACYHLLRKRLRGKNSLSRAEKIKLAEAEFRLGDYEAAWRAAENVLRSDPQQLWGTYWLSKAHSALATDCFVKVATLNPDSPRVHQMLAQHYAGWGDYTKAKTEYLAAIRLVPDLPDLHLGLATVYRHAAEWSQAQTELERTLELAPGSAVARYQLGNTYVQQRQWESAVPHLRQVLADSSLAFGARLDLSKAESEMGQTHQALEDLLPIAPEDKDGEVHYRIAQLYRKLGDSDHAQEALEIFKRLHAASQQASDKELDLMEERN